MVRPVTASIFTWEQTTAFDGDLSDKELRRRFHEEFPDFADVERVMFWSLIAFNTSDGRKHRFLVVFPREDLVGFRASFERCLPRQIILYKVADAILRGEYGCNSCEKCNGCEKCDFAEKCNSCEKCDFAEKCYSCVKCGCADLNDGNLLLTAIFEGKLYLLVFVAGRLCHWSEECGYDSENKDALKRLCMERVKCFQSFMAKDCFFLNAVATAASSAAMPGAVLGAAVASPAAMPGAVLDAAVASSAAIAFPHSFRTCCLPSLEFDENLFRKASKDSFWRHLDLDKTTSAKACVQRKRLLLSAILLLLTAAISLYHSLIEPLVSSFLGNRLLNENACEALWTSQNDSATSEKNFAQTQTAQNTVDAYFLQNSLNRKNLRQQHPLQSRRSLCAKPDLTVNGIVSGRAILAEIATEKKVLRLGDSVGNYRIESIGRSDVLLKCGRRKLLLEPAER